MAEKGWRDILPNAVVSMNKGNSRAAGTGRSVGSSRPRATRFPVDERVDYEAAALRGSTYAGNLSTTGMFLRGVEGVLPGTGLVLHLHLRGVAKPLALRVTVRRVVAAQESGIGVEILPSQDAAIELLARYIESEIVAALEGQTPDTPASAEAELHLCLHYLAAGRIARALTSCRRALATPSPTKRACEALAHNLLLEAVARPAARPRLLAALSRVFAAASAFADSRVLRETRAEAQALAAVPSPRAAKRRARKGEDRSATRR